MVIQNLSVVRNLETSQLLLEKSMTFQDIEYYILMSITSWDMAKIKFSNMQH